VFTGAGLQTLCDEGFWKYRKMASLERFSSNLPDIIKSVFLKGFPIEKLLVFLLVIRPNIPAIAKFR
jgi:hypothetical protein